MAVRRQNHDMCINLAGFLWDPARLAIRYIAVYKRLGRGICADEKNGFPNERARYRDPVTGGNGFWDICRQRGGAGYLWLMIPRQPRPPFSQKASALPLRIDFGAWLAWFTMIADIEAAPVSPCISPRVFNDSRVLVIAHALKFQDG